MEAELEWDDAPIIPFNAWQISEVTQIDENGVTNDTVLFLYSEQTGEKLGILLHPQTAANIGLDLINEYVNP